MNSRKLLCALTLIWTLSAHAQEPSKICNTVDSCHDMQLQLNARRLELNRQIVREITEAALKNGAARLMTWDEAKRYCEGKNEEHKFMRLPTNRELAILASQWGASPIRETAYPDLAISYAPELDQEISRMEKQGYVMLRRFQRLSRDTVDFYFKSSGYQPSKSALRNYVIWSDSPVRYGNEAYAWNGADGEIGLRDPGQMASVVCMP